MKLGLIALDPTVQKSHSLDQFFEILKLLMQRKMFFRTSIASVVQPSLYAVPSSAYRDLKGTFIKEAKHRIKAICQGRLDFSPIHILASDSHAQEHHVDQLTRCARRLGLDMLILASNDRSGLPYWFLGSFSETAALTAKIPVFIIKPSLNISDLSREVRFVLAVDAASPPNATAVKWIADLARSTDAHISLVYVEPKRRLIIDSLQQRKEKEAATKVLNKIEADFNSNGIKTRKSFLQESKSVAHTIVEFSEHSRAWLTITTASERSGVRKLFLGSTARKVLTLTRRPLLSLRLH